MFVISIKDVRRYTISFQKGKTISDYEDMAIAAKHNFINILDFHHKRGTGKSWIYTVDFAAGSGSFEAVKWLRETRKQDCSENAIIYATVKGFLDIVKYIYENWKERHPENGAVMNWAAKNGHFEIVKYFHENREEGCTTWAMDWAAANGHFDIVKWLHENREEGCTTWAMDWAAQNGHLHIVKWLHENRKEGYTSYAMDWAAENGHLEVVKWLCENRKKGYSDYYNIDDTITSGHFEIVRYLKENTF